MRTRTGPGAWLVGASLALASMQAGASLIIDFEVVPSVITVQRGDDYILRTRVTNNSDAGETFGAIPGADFTASGFSLAGAAFPGQTATPLFGSFPAVLSLGQSFEFDLVRMSGDRGTLGALPLGTFAQSIAMGIFRCSGSLCFGHPGVTANFTLNVVPEPGVAALLALGLLGVGGATRARRRPYSP